jgi:hypothetical protein
MRALALIALLSSGCSMDWSLARLAPADAAAPSDASVAQSLLVRCDQLPALSRAPTIDGVLEPNVPLLQWLDDGMPDVPQGIAASAAVAYRPDGVYFYVEVQDPTRDPAPLGDLVYCGDSVELYADADGVIQAPPDYDNPGTIQVIVGAPVDAATPSRRGERFRFATGRGGVDLGPWTSPNFVAAPTPRGYAVEALVVAGDLDLSTWTLAPGAKIGWNMTLNIGGPEDAGIDACTTRSQQIHFRFASSGVCTAPYCNAAAFCTPTLGAP